MIFPYNLVNHQLQEVRNNIHTVIIPELTAELKAVTEAPKGKYDYVENHRVFNQLLQVQ